MATCKDCLHFEVCDSGRHIGEYEIDDGVYSDGVENQCLAFKNKADFVEVVRCKDCLHKINYKGRAMCTLYAEEALGVWYGLNATRDEHFCSYGERGDT